MTTRRHPQDRWQQIDDLFARALELAPPERAGFLASECGDDVTLHDKVAALLAASDRATADLASPANDLLRQAFSDPSDTEEGAFSSRAPGDPVGRYRIIGELGRGGMALVYQAERADGAYEQRVAIKLLRRGVENAEGARRFQIETQILSTLTHPNIAKLLDAGTTTDGEPFLVMELVEGEPITTWADRNRLSVDERLGLFEQVAEAVSFAHKHLVIHRDIKPSNVLVDQEGRVKLLDFGIAKLLEADETAIAETKPTTRWMTPGYASPEQILGRPVTTSTDVHGLGVLLYELLAGRRPFGGDGVVGFDLEKAVCEEPPTRPSDVVAGTTAIAEARNTGPEKLQRRLSGDLDAIVSKALRKEPDERYASVQAMSNDVARHRSGFPVEARAGLRVYRARKFLSRHWFGVGAAAAIAVVLAASSLLLWRQQIQTAVARDRASTEAENAGLVIDFLADVFRGRNPDRAPSDTVTARDLLAWGSERVDTEFTDRPALQAELLEVLGSAYRNLGLFDQAIEHLTRSVDISRSAYGDHADEVAERLIKLSATYRADRDWAPALSHAREALEIRRTATHDSLALAESLEEVASAWAGVGQPDSAEPLLREALEIHRAVDDSTYVNTLVNLAMVRRQQGAFEEAASLYKEAIPRLRTQTTERVRLAVPLNNYAFLLRTLGDYGGAEPLYREALAIQSDVYGRGHPSTLLLANNLASVLSEQGKTEELEAVLRESLAAAQAQWPKGHWRVGAQHAALARALLRSRQFDDAFDELQAAHGIYTRLLGPRHLWTLFIDATAAAGLVAQGQVERGQAYLDTFYQYRAETPRDTTDLAAERDFVEQIGTFIHLLDGLNLVDEADRYRALLENPMQKSEHATR